MSTSKYAEAHANPQGPGDARPTALSIVEDEGLVDKLSGKVALVTGSSSGIGIETARALHVTGAHVYLAVRDVKRGKEVAEEILASGSNKAGVDVIELHLDSLDSVRAGTADFLKKSKNQLNILVNNAGVMACPQSLTKDGFETQFGTNHLGHHLLFQLLKPALLASATPDLPSRLVSLSSVGHRGSPIRFDDLDFKKGPYDAFVSYGQAKTANIYLANEVESRYGAQGLHAFSVHPGGIFTNLARHLDPAFLKNFDTPTWKRHIKSPEQGAATSLWAALSKDLLGNAGAYLEDCSVSQPGGNAGADYMKPGYADWAYDKEASARLWKVSNALVGLPEE